MKRKITSEDQLPPAKKAKTSAAAAPNIEIRRVATTIDDCWDYIAKDRNFSIDPALQSLTLDGDVFDLKQAMILEGAIASTSSLREVTFNGAYLGAKGLPGIAKGLRNQLHLHTLDLGGNNLRDDGVKLVFEFLKGNKTLTKLNLSANGLTLSDDWAIEPLTTSSLKILYLQENNINEGEAYIAKALATSTTLEELNVGYNKFESAVMISGALASNKSLKVLNLAGLKLQDFGVKHLVTGLRQNDSLVGVNLGHTQMGHNGVIELMTLVKTKTNLRYIELTGNNVSKEVVDAFHDVLAQRRKLWELNEGRTEEEQLDKRLEEMWVKPDDDKSTSSDEVQEIENEQNTNNKQSLIEPKQEKNNDNDAVDYTELDVFLLDDLWDKPEAVNFVEKHPEISVEKVVPEPFGLYEMNSLYNSFYKTLQDSLQKLDEKMQQACNQTKELLGPIEQMQQTRRSLELERTLLNQKIEKFDKEFKKRAEGYLLKEVNAIKVSDRHAEAVKNLENTRKLRSTCNKEFKQWQKKLKTDITTWDVNDVSTFLDEVEIWGCGARFEENQINGGVLVNLTTEELMHDLEMTFHQAKRLQLFILMVKAGKSIYDKLPPVLDWDNEQVLRWLNESSFSAHEDKFKTHAITGIELYLLEKSDLANKLQITALGDRAKLMQAIEVLRAENNPFESNKVVPAEPANRETRNDPPSVLLCPITKELMTDPVQASDGHTYERSAIVEWFKSSNVSPVTKEPLKSLDVIPSHALKAMLDEYNKGK